MNFPAATAKCDFKNGGVASNFLCVVRCSEWRLVGPRKRARIHQFKLMLLAIKLARRNCGLSRSESVWSFGQYCVSETFVYLDLAGNTSDKLQRSLIQNSAKLVCHQFLGWLVSLLSVRFAPVARWFCGGCVQRCTIVSVDRVQSARGFSVATHGAGCTCQLHFQHH